MFDDIRPYNDDEVSMVLERLLVDHELLETIGRMRLKTVSRMCPVVTRAVIAWHLKRELRYVLDVKSLQGLVKKYMDRMIDKTTTSFAVSGLHELDIARPYLFVSNHRDIALDPAFVSYALYHNQRDTVRIAIGDNLLSKPFVADLMRLNKSFIVNRSATGKKMLAAYKKLSAYIRHSIQEDRKSIWIAQREGRAKDGLDKTEPAIIRMFSMSRHRKEESFASFIRGMNIVPVAISYEWDPCDSAKAGELAARHRGDSYEKDSHEDLLSIGRGITGQKGVVHVHFGTPLCDDFKSPEHVADEIDRQIWNGYRLHPSNIVAYRRLYKEPIPSTVARLSGNHDQRDLAATDKELDRRLSQQPADVQRFLLDMYANSVVSRLKQPVNEAERDELAR